LTIARGNEVDVVVEEGAELLAIETKSSQTVARDFFAGPQAFARDGGSRATRSVRSGAGADLPREEGARRDAGGGHAAAEQANANAGSVTVW
jgi:hypothetical protein